ncbi:MAG: 1,4-dihydroxy-2-naphthoate polyprenyltransferase [Rhodospirillales bacterium]|nr:1,4-dihydroxy-2-naphthoate polyprenyltransferase [Rhodospirillales bacterium]
MPPSPLLVWWLGIRPKTLSIAVAPVIVGSAVAWAETGTILITPMIVALLGAVFIQAGTNLHNDSADYRKGTDAPGRPGPKRITAEGWATPKQVTKASYIAFAFAAIAGCYLIWVGGWPILLLGLASILSGLAYTGGPRPIAYTGLGELFVFLFFGLGAVMGSHFLQTGAPSLPAFLAACAIGFPAAAVLTVNNYRDRDDDQKAGKNTLAVRIGSTATKVEYIALLHLPFIFLFLIKDLAPWVWLPLLSLPLATYLCHKFTTTEPGPAFNTVLAQTAMFQLAFSLLFCIGLTV